MQNFSNIPGQIEPIEQNSLYNVCQSLEIKENECIIEFGAFFGRSAKCIVEGIKSNATYAPSNCTFHVYDSFKCHSNGRILRAVNKHAKHGGVEKYITREDDWYDFSGIFEHFHHDDINSGAINLIKSELNNSLPPEEKIAFMHIDCPKRYQELKIILYRFFPKLRVNSLISFQDFFFHWSATLIAAFTLLYEKGYLEIISSAASSIYVRVKKVPTMEEITEIDLELDKEQRVIDLLQCAIDTCQKIKLDRKEIFLPRVYLAKMQYLWSKGRNEESVNEIANFFANGFKLNQSVINDFIDLMNHGFEIDKLYEQDRAS